MAEEPQKKVLKKRQALGKGLGALLSDSDYTKKDHSNQPEKSVSDSVSEVLLANIEMNPFQPRQDFDKELLEELGASIKLHGIIQPVTLRKLSTDKYQLISGERRCQASKLIGLEKVPAYVRTANDQQMLEMALIENIQRENLNPIEIAFSYQRLLTECELKQEELGDRVGKKRATVTNYLRLLKLPPEIQAALRDKEISMGHARALINIENIDMQLAILKKILLDDLSVRKVEELVKNITKGSPKTEEKKDLAPTAEFEYELKRLQAKLSSRFSSKIQVKASSGEKGEIKIPFESTDDLNRILDLLNYS